MSRDDLARVRSADALQQTLRFEYLEAYHVPFDELTNATVVEHELGHWATRQGKVALIGASGSGKSSVMAAVLGQLNDDVPEWLVPLRVPMELAEPEIITTARGFARHLVRQVTHWAAPEALTTAEQDELDRRTADLERLTGRKRRARFVLGAPAYLADAKLSADIAGAGPDVERELTAGDIVRQTQRMIELFRARDLEPFLVFDDTDSWLRLPGEEEESVRLAGAFFNTNIRMLAKELDCGFAVAVHDDYLTNPGYQQVADLLAHIEIPRFPDSVGAIRRILQRRFDVDELEIAVDEVFDSAALDYLSFEYDDVPDVRRVIGIAARAITKALEDPDSEIVGKAAVRAARAERASLGGRR